MGKHTRPRVSCALPFRHEGPAVITPFGTCCGSCGFPTVLRIVRAG